MKSNTTFLTDEEKLNLTPGDMFDRIINLKITCADSTGRKEEFVIRSDYEMVWDDVMSDTLNVNRIVSFVTKGCQIRRCTHKPSIKVQCKMVTSSLGTSVEVFVTNFYLLSKDGAHLRSFNSSQYKILSVEIVMGYWSQFRLGKESENIVPSYNDYFNIDARFGADKITLTGAIVVTTEKLPPDSVLHIKGYVGDVYSSPVAISNVVDVNIAEQKVTASSNTDLTKIMFDCITRRYLNRHYFTDGLGSKLPSTKQLITVSDLTKFDVPIVYDPVTGLVNDASAKIYGVKVYLSEELKKYKIPQVIDSDGKAEKVDLFFEEGFTIGQTITRLASILGLDLNYTFDLYGDVLVYTAKEASTPEELYKAFKTQGLYKASVLANKALYDNKLPAVYNINIDAVATIVCPFFTFLQPYQYIEFASRYALTSDTSFFASYNPTITRFLVINANISFATVDNNNDVQITAVAMKGVI